MEKKICLMHLDTIGTRTLPFLPGNTFEDPLLKDHYHKKQIFNFRTDQPVVNDFLVPEEVDVNSSLASVSEKLSTLQFGEPRPVRPHISESADPNYRKVLRFYGYFKEGVVESNLERYRVRNCVIYYYLEDNTIHVSEPKQDNSGIPQGILIKRQLIPSTTGPSQFITYESFNIGKEVTLFGKTIRIVDCDKFSRGYLEDKGIHVPQPEEYPFDEYTSKRDEIKRNQNPIILLGPQDKEMKRYLEYTSKGRHCAPSADEKISMLKYLDRAKQVLRFYCCWDDRESLYGDFRMFTLEFFLADGCIKVAEDYIPNSGRDPSPAFIKKQKIVNPETNQHFAETDFAIGKTVVLYAKRMFIYDCDEFTRAYYREKYGEDNFESVDVKIKKPALVRGGNPPYNGFGSEEDSLGSWKFLTLRPPKKDAIKFMNFDKQVLRFGASLENPIPEDAERKFVITYYLADDTISIYEPPQRNTGVMGGKFLQRRRVKNTNGEYYNPSDLYVGATVQILSHRFVLNQTDERTLKYMESRPKEFTMADVNAAILRVKAAVSQKHVRAREAFRELDLDKSGTITVKELKKLLELMNLNVPDQELIAIFRYFDRDADGEITFDEFKQTMFPTDFSGAVETKVDATSTIKSTSEPNEEVKVTHTQSQREKEQMQNSIFKKFKAKFDSRKLLFQDVFRALSDKSNDGLIGAEEFKKAMEHNIKMYLTEEEMSSLIEKIFSVRKRMNLRDLIKIVDGTSTWNITTTIV